MKEEEAARLESVGVNASYHHVGASVPESLFSLGLKVPT